jgi:quercetin dioxygenase-like cupin family protein
MLHIVCATLGEMMSKDDLMSGKLVSIIPRKIKPWGHEDLWAFTDKYVGKILFIKAGHRLSKQYHNIKDETIHVLSGDLKLYLNEMENEILAYEGASFRIHPGLIHRFEATNDDVILLEVSTPELDDIVRLKDDYDRIKD